MAGLDRRIDPLTGDYIDDGEGGYEETDTAETAAYHQITTHRGKYFPQPDLGSDTHLLVQRNADAITALFAAESLQAALQKLADEGMIKDIEVEVTVTKEFPARLVGGASFTDAQRGTVDLSDAVGFGKPDTGG